MRKATQKFIADFHKQC